MGSLGIAIWISVIVGILVRGQYWYIPEDTATSADNANDWCEGKLINQPYQVRYLASINTFTAYTSINSYRESQRVQNCWIGLILTHTFDSNVSYSWFDGSDCDIQLINTLWCTGYPLRAPSESNNSYTTTKSYTYMNGSCLINTFNVNEAISKFVCGPRVSQPLECWIVKCILPIILLLSVLLYSVHILWNFVYNLYIFRHNWLNSHNIKPSKPVQVTAILFILNAFILSFCGIIFAILYIVGYVKSGIINEQHNSGVDSLYPQEYKTAQGMKANNIISILTMKTYEIRRIHTNCCSMWWFIYRFYGIFTHFITIA